MQLTTTYQKIGEVNIGNAGYGTITLRLYGRYIQQNQQENYTEVQYQLRHYLPSSYTQIRYYSSSQKFTGELTDSSTNANYFTCKSGETTLLTKSKIITHEEDGSKSISVGASFTNSYFTSNPTVTIGQVTVDLPKINRASTVVLNNGEYFFLDKGAFEPNTIPIAVTKYVDTYTTNLKFYYETSSEDGAPRTFICQRDRFNSTNFSFSILELTDLYEAMRNTFFIRIICVAETYDNEVKIGETEYVTIGMISKTEAQPEFSDFEYQDINNVTKNLTKDPQVLIKGYSQIQMTISSDNKAKGQKWANITTYTFANGTQSEDVTGLTYPINFSKFIAQSEILKITAIDSRLEATSVEKNISEKWINYSNIEKYPFSAERKNGGTSSQVTLKLEGKIWDGNFSSTVANGIKSAIYKYKKTTDDEWTDGTTTLNVVKNGSSYSLEQDIAGDLGATGFDQEESYDIYVEISDQLSTISDTFTLGAGSPGIARYKNCVALGAPYDESLGGRVQIPKVTGETDFVTNLKKAGKEVATLEDIKDVWQDLNLTDAGKVTLTVHTFKTNGKRVVLDVNIYPKSTINAGDTLDIITIPQEYQPRNIVVAYTFSGTKTGAMWIERNTNVVRLRNQVGGWTTSNGLNISLTWDLF